MKFKTFIFIVCNLLLFSYMAGAYILPNWVNYFAPSALFLLTVALLPGNFVVLAAVADDLTPVILYFLYFIVGAAWALYPLHSLYNILLHTVFLFGAMLFALCARYRSFEDIIRLFQIAVYSALVVNLIAFFGSSSSVQITRLGGGSISIVAVLLPYLLIYRSGNLLKKYIPVFIAAGLLLVSMNRTPLVCAFVAAVLAIVFTQKNAVRAASKLLGFALLGAAVVGVLLVTPVVGQFVTQTFGRLLLFDVGFGDDLLDAEGVDVLRWSIFEEANRLYPQHWLEGMGYMGFMQWYGETFNVVASTESGKDVVGVNLHNSYQTWALEGGIVCVLIVIYVIYKYIKVSRRKIRSASTAYERDFHIVGLTTLVPLGIYAMFHQLHQAPILYIMLGIVLAGASDKASAVSALRARAAQ